MKFTKLAIVAIALIVTSNVMCAKDSEHPQTPHATPTPQPLDPQTTRTPEVTSTPQPTDPQATTPPEQVIAKPLPVVDSVITPVAQKCADAAIARLLKFEQKCISAKSRKSDKICRKYKIRDSCRRKTDKKARKASRKCGTPVLLVRTLDAAPEDCRLCGEGVNKLLEACIPSSQGFRDRCKAWIYRQRKIKCYQDQFKHFAEICGSKNLLVLDVQPGRKPRGCVEQKPEECEAYARKRIEKKFTQCQTATEGITDGCQSFQARVACWSEKHKRAAFWSKFCQKDIFYPIPHFRPPPNCYHNDSQDDSADGQANQESDQGQQHSSDGVHHEWYHHSWDNWFNYGHNSNQHDTPISCEEKAKERINSKHSTCEQAAQWESNQCRRLNLLRHCDDMTRERTIRWNAKCKIDIPLRPPRLGMPMNCAGNNDASCAKTASKENQNHIKECLDKTKTMKMNSCGLLHYRNHCYLEGLAKQLEETKKCHYTWVNILVKFEINSECPMDNCLQTGKDLIGKINETCKASVADSKINECAKARKINSCLQDYEFVPKFFNQTCHEKMLLMLSYEDESLACAKNDSVVPVVGATAQ